MLSSHGHTWLNIYAAQSPCGACFSEIKACSLSNSMTLANLRLEPISSLHCFGNQSCVCSRYRNFRCRDGAQPTAHHWCTPEFNDEAVDGYSDKGKGTRFVTPYTSYMKNGCQTSRLLRWPVD